MVKQTPDVLVRFQNIQKSYDGETLVVKDLNLDIHHGEFLSLLGPSGSGKTTCLMMLAGFEHPTAGQITLDGASLNDVPPHKRNIGMVFQNYALFPHMTVSKNLEYPLKVRKIPADQRKQKIQEALAMVQMEAFANRHPAQLSGGQQQRVALARALVFKPKLVLMDEPLGALDKQLREHMQIELKSLHRSLGITFVYVTHDQSEALTMSDRVAVFDQGIIQQVSTVDTLYETPENRFVAGFVGDCNHFPAVITAADGDTCTAHLANGDTITANNIQNLPVNDKCIIAIRPERLSVVDNANLPNVITTKVLDRVYFGDHIRLRCSHDNEPAVFVKLPLSSPHAMASLTPGQQIFLQADPTHIRAFRP